jgi:hypothetical protein
VHAAGITVALALGIMQASPHGVDNPPSHYIRFVRSE